MDDVRVRPGGEQGLVEAHGAAHVRVERLVDGRVERDHRRRVDHDVEAGGQFGNLGHAAVEHGDPLTDDPFGLLGPHGVPPAPEHGFAQEVPEPVLPGLSALSAHEQPDVGGGVIGEQPLEHGLPDEAGRAGEQDVRGAEFGLRTVRDHGRSLDSTVDATPGPMPGSASTMARIRPASALPR